MAAALYAPGIGYYAAGNIKLPGAASRASCMSALPPGDFVTAPELTPVFARTLANEIAAVLCASGSLEVLEFGAGSGALAADLIEALKTLGLGVHYTVIEVSADLQAVQRQRLAPYGEQVQWRNNLPETFTGCVVANEVIDAMPVRAFMFDASAHLLERGVTVDAQGRFIWASRPAPDDLRVALDGRLPAMPGYCSEINLQGEAWMRAMSRWLTRGAALLIDYGFPQMEYYHPQRVGGTLMAHIRHHAHDDVLAAPGIQDITAHVDFTAMAQAALDGGMDLLGFAAQGRYLMNAGLARHLPATDAAAVGATATHAQTLSAVNTLVCEAEMGELFKVLAVGRGIGPVLTGFSNRDRRHTL